MRAELRRFTVLESGGVCNTSSPRACWQDKSTGFSYKDKDLTPDGVAKLLLKEGLVAGTTKITLKAKGTLLDDPMFPLAQPVTVQLNNTGSGLCWEATYSAPATTNDGGPPGQFKDKAD